MTNDLILDRALISRYDLTGPRYTSYPTALEFHEGFSKADYTEAAIGSNTGHAPLSLYFHIPFCARVCFYCACNKVVTKDRSKAQEYLSRLYREIELQSALFDSGRVVRQLHWGGGTPTFLNHAQMRELMQVTRQHFKLLDNDEGEYSIEIDPREADRETVAVLRDIGFNRMSIGVQDLDERVQQAVNRIQSEAQTFGLISQARDAGFRSISIDLIYGLPHQSVDSFSRTLDRVLQIAPDRLSVFNYAHLPERFKPQRRINADELPSAAEKLNILQMAGEKLAAAGYRYIGMDHFAKPDDELAIAQDDETLYRNFQGYSTHADCDLIGLGVTSIGSVGKTYVQNARTLDDYYACIDAGELAVERGVKLNRDDQIRREIITWLICHFELSFQAVEVSWGIKFQRYFGQEMASLRRLEADGLLRLSDSGIEVLPAGRPLIRNICMVFDAYLNNDERSGRFSKVI